MKRIFTTLAATLAFGTTALVTAQNPGESDYSDGGQQLQDANGQLEAEAAKKTQLQPCRADIDGDGIVDVHDLVYVMGDWSHCTSDSPEACQSDTNGDGQVNVEDLIFVIENWGTICPTAAH